MKVQAANSLSPSAKPKAKKRNVGGFGVAGQNSEGVETINQANAPFVLGALIELQGGAGQSDQQTLSWSTDVLDVLEKLQYGLLTGALSQQDLRALLKSIEDEPVRSSNPELAALQAQILLRARVELAKLSTSS